MRIAVVGVLLAASTGVVSAQSVDYDALEHLFGEPITTSVTGSPQRASEVPASMELIDAAEIRRSGARDLPTLLAHVVGIDVLRFSYDDAEVGSRGYNQALSPRLLVLVDGRQVYADFYGFTPWTTIPVEIGAIRQIEVVRGPNSALFGFNAVGGVINIITYDPLGNMPHSVTTSAGTQGFREVSGVSGWQLGNDAGIRLSAGRRQHDDFSTLQQPVDVGTRRGSSRDAFDVKGAVRFSDAIRADFEAAYSDVGQVLVDNVYSSNWTESDTKSLRATVSAETGVGLIQGSLYTNQLGMDGFKGSQPSPIPQIDNTVSVARVETLSKLGSRHTLRFSAEERSDAMGTTPITGGNVLYDVTALSTMWEWRVAEPLTLTAALRHDQLDLARHGTVPPGYSLTNADWNRDINETSFNAGLAWRLTNAGTLRFLVARGAQLPSLLNLGGLLLPLPPIGFVTGIPSLSPTIVTSREVSWQRFLPPLRATLSVSAFRGDTSDIVATVGGSDFANGLASMPVNFGDSHVQGLEISISGAAENGWRWGASSSVVMIDDRFAPGYSVANTVVDFEHTAPRHVIDGNVGWTRGPWEVDGYLRYKSHADAIATTPTYEGSLVPLSSYTMIDGRVAYQLNARTLLAVAGQGLGRSEQVESTSPAVERRLVATVTVSFL